LFSFVWYHDSVQVTFQQPGSVSPRIGLRLAFDEAEAARNTSGYTLHLSLLFVRAVASGEAALRLNTVIKS
jgi:hypothetical protein